MNHHSSFPLARLPRRASRLIAIAAVTALLVCPVHAASSQETGSAGAGLTLRALLDSARNGHPSIRAAESRVRAAEGNRVTARAFGNPVLSHEVDQTPFPGGRPLPGIDRQAMTTATLPLEGLYQRGPRVARGNAQVRAAEADAMVVRQRVALDAATAYFRAAIAQVQLATTRDLVGWLDTVVAYNRSRVTEGVTSEADLIRSELERDRMTAEAGMQAAELAQARAALTAFLSDSPAPVGSALLAVDGMPFPLPAAGRVTSALERRPDVRAGHERVTAATANVAAERAMTFRQLGATIGTMRMSGTTSMIAGISLPVPLFDPNRGEIQRANAERDAALFDLAAQERTANAELRGAYDAARLLTDRAEPLARRDSSSFLARAEESRRIALGAYREGAVPLLQVIDAARTWADVRLTYYRTIFAQQQSVVALIVAQGLDLYSALPAPATPGDLRR
jgi:cobalt-zinc-cadmium efflux system outer membrane protein